MLWIGNREGRWTFWNWGDIFVCLQKAGKRHGRRSRWNTTLRRRLRTSAVLVRKLGNIPKWSVPQQSYKSNKRRLTSLHLKAKVVRFDYLVVSERQINSLPGLLAVQIIWQKISLNNRLTHQFTTPTNKRWQWRTQAEQSRLKSGQPLMRGLSIHKNIAVSNTNLTVGLRVFSIALTWQQINSSELTRERSRVHRRWAFCFRPKACMHRSSNQILSLLLTRIILMVHNV